MMWKQARRHSIRIEGEQSSLLEMSCSRLMVLGGFFILAFTVILGRSFVVGVVQGDLARLDIAEQSEDGRVEKQSGVTKVAVRRGDVYDRNGMLLATSLKSASLYVDPYLVRDANELAGRLVKVFPDLDLAETARILSKKTRFEWLKRPITTMQEEKVLELGEPALAFQDEDVRVYPQGSLVAHMVGFSDRDGNGLSGIERGANADLVVGKDVHLTLDNRLQHIVKREVQKAIDDFTAKGGVGIIMDAQNGDILAGVSLPDFDLNIQGVATDDQKFTRLTLGTYELGSVFKIFSTAAFLDKTNSDMSKSFDARDPIKIGHFRVTDYHAQKRVLTLPEMFMYSSNIATAKMAIEAGGDQIQKFYRDVGLFTPMNFGIKEIGYPQLPKPWRDSTTVTASYGHGIATTPMQAAAGVASIVNGGILVRPNLVKSNNNQHPSAVRVVSEETSEKMRKLMRLVVTMGTGKNANVDGYALGGKTGTAEKSVNGRYAKDKLISSFIGVFPIDKPRYIVMVMVDEPIGNKKSYGYATAGWVAAPPVARIVTAMAAVLGLPAQETLPENDLDHDLLPFLKEKKAEPVAKKSEVKTLVSYR